MNNKKLIVEYTGGQLREILLGLDTVLEDMTEIRIRINKPLAIKILGHEYFVDISNQLLRSDRLDSDSIKKMYKPSANDIKKTIELMSNYSLYAFAEEIRNGYITLPGGHRVGICGQAVIDKGDVKTIKNINGFNIRVTHEVKGCANKIVDDIALPVLKHTMIISPPGCGKTTLLRDAIRLLSSGTKKFKGYNVGVADERSEIAGCYMGVSQNDLGLRTDVLDACPKASSMMMLLRSMSPQIIAADEIGRREDIEAIDIIINSGVKLLCTAHGNSLQDIRNKPVLSELVNKNIFERFIVLKYKQTPGEIDEIYDGSFRILYSNHRKEALPCS